MIPEPFIRLFDSFFFNLVFYSQPSPTGTTSHCGLVLRIVLAPANSKFASRLLLHASWSVITRLTSGMYGCYISPSVKRNALPKTDALSRVRRRMGT